MFSYSCPGCNQRLLAAPEKSGTRTICPKCLKPLTVPAADRDAAVDLEQVLEPAGQLAGEVSLHSGNLVSANLNQPVGALTVTSDTPGLASYDIDLEKYDMPGSREKESTITHPPLTPLPVQNISKHEPLSIDTPAPFPTAKRRTMSRDLAGMVNLTPTGMFDVDMTAELSAAISMRMKPPPEAYSDQLITKAAGLIMTGAGVLLWAASVIFRPDWLICVGLVGAAMIAFGVFWRAYLTAKNRGTKQGLIALLPPLCVMKLFKPAGEYGLRPLRFVLMGSLILSLFLIGPDVRKNVKTTLKSAGFSTTSIQ